MGGIEQNIIPRRSVSADEAQSQNQSERAGGFIGEKSRIESGTAVLTHSIHRSL